MNGLPAPSATTRKRPLLALVLAILLGAAAAIGSSLPASPASAQSFVRGIAYSVKYVAPGPCTSNVDRKIGEYAVSSSAQNAAPHKAGSEYRGQIFDAYVARQYTKVYTRTTYVKWSECRGGKYYDVLYLGKPVTRCWAVVYQMWGNVPVYSSAGWTGSTHNGHVSGKGPCPL